MSAYRQAAAQLESGVRGTFAIATGDVTPEMKNGVVAGIKQSLTSSFGYDAKPGLTLGM